jgi:LysM repeat protein
MRNKSRFYQTCLIAVFFAILATSVAVIAILFLRGVQRTRIAANIPPSVLVHAPTNGESVSAGKPILVYVTATAQYPISRLELWLDGTIAETQIPDPALGEVTTYYAISELQITEGPHSFSARAVDANGLIGQSPPIFIQGDALPATAQVTTQEGQTLQDIADANGTDSDLLKAINPDLGDMPLPGGSKVIVPVPGGNNPPGNTGPSIIPPAPLPIPPTDVVMLPIAGPVIDIGSLIPILLTTRPKAPTSLKAGFENCSIRLLWMDNADNEAYFHVWMQALGGPPKVIATLTGSPHTGPAWYEFDSPWVGIYSFWIEAVNAYGGQSSEIAWVGVNDLSCGPRLATHLNIETVDMFVNGAYNSVYCYLSVEGAPEKRIPSDDSQFVQVAGGWGDVSHWSGNGNSFLLPEPQDGEVTLEGTCLGWQGASGPDNLGTFSASAPKETWDGRRMELKGTGFTIGYRIQPHGPGAANGSFTYVDYSLPLPFQPWVTTETSTNPLENDKLARRPTLNWIWNGDQNKLTGFILIMDGKPIKTVPTNWFVTKSVAFAETILLPTSCGGVYTFEVAANSGEAMSDLSMPYEYKQPACATYAEVKFVEIVFGCLDDGDVPVIPFMPMDCESGSFGKSDTIEAYYWLAVHGEMVNISPGDMTTDIHYSFHDMGMHSPQKNQYASYDTFLVPINPQNPAIWFGLKLKDADPWWDADDHICDIGKDLSMPYSAWASYDKELELECHSRDGHGWVTVHVRGTSSPDPIRSSNPGIGPPVGP